MSTNDTQTKRRPAVEAFEVTGEGDAVQWKKIGAAWSTKSGKGYALELGDKRIILPPAKPAKATGTDTGAKKGGAS